MTPELARDAVLAYLIQYGGLGLVFLLGIGLAYKQGDVGLKTPHQRLWLFIMLGGFALYAVLHGVFQFWGPTW